MFTAGLTITVVVGNVVREPKQRVTAKGFELCEFRIGTDSDSSGRMQTFFYDVQAWGPLGLHALSLKVGDRVIIVGHLAIRSSVRPDGSYQTWAQIVADEIGYSMAFRTTDGRFIDNGPQRRDVAPPSTQTSTDNPFGR